MNQERIAWIDNAKFVGIICVILGHHCLSGTVGGIISGPIIFSFHMPLFFFINGLTPKEIVDKTHFIQRKVKTLFLPYVIAVLFAMLTNDLLRKWLFVDTLHLTDFLV